MSDGTAGGYAAVVFDMDGTLVELTDGDLIRETAAEAFRAAGIDPTDDELAAIVDGTTANARAICRDRGVDPAAFYDRFDPLFAERQVDLVSDGGKPPFPDATDALDRLGAGTAADGGHDPSVAAAVVSNNYQSVVDRVVERHFGGRFPVAYGTTPGLAGRRRRKPDPRRVQQALSDLGVPAERALMVGDTADDVGAATAAGMDVALVDRDGSVADLDTAPTHRIAALDALPALVAGGT